MLTPEKGFIMNVSIISKALEAMDIEFTVTTDEKGRQVIACNLPANVIHIPEELLRPISEADKVKMIAGINSQGQLFPILVEYNTVTGRFELRDGLQRITAMSTINPLFSVKVYIGDYDLMTSIIANTARVQQKTSQVIKAVKMLVERGTPFKSIASDLGLTEAQVSKYFNMSYLPESGKLALAKGLINESQACTISDAVKGGKLRPEQIELMIQNASGLVEGKGKASSIELVEMRKTFALLNKKEYEKANGIVSEPKHYTHKEAFNSVRLEEIKSRIDKKVIDIELDGGELTEAEKTILGIIDYVFTRTPKDIAEGQVEWDKKHNPTV